jgi:hypothetical protein
VKPLALCAAVLLVLLAGCAGDDDAAPTQAAGPTATSPPVTVTQPAPQTQTAPAPTEPEQEEGAPAEPPPDAAGTDDGPPPAWIETSGGPAWLARGSFCWESLCVDTALPRCDDGSAPPVQIQAGETVRFHLGFEPTEATLSVEGSTPEALPAARTIEWNANRAGLLLLALRTDVGDASYAACLEILGV